MPPLASRGVHGSLKLFPRSVERHLGAISPPTVRKPPFYPGEGGSSPAACPTSVSPDPPLPSTMGWVGMRWLGKGISQDRRGRARGGPGAVARHDQQVTVLQLRDEGLAVGSSGRCRQATAWWQAVAALTTRRAWPPAGRWARPAARRAAGAGSARAAARRRAPRRPMSAGAAAELASVSPPAEHPARDVGSHCTRGSRVSSRSAHHAGIGPSSGDTWSRRLSTPVEGSSWPTRVRRCGVGAHHEGSERKGRGRKKCSNTAVAT